tara:strand:+ start:29517 stop:29864 length:348 start_codon:yes stop_codon:yes gene_type:complete
MDQHTTYLKLQEAVLKEVQDLRKEEDREEWAAVLSRLGMLYEFESLNGQDGTVVRALTERDAFEEAYKHLGSEEEIILVRVHDPRDGKIVMDTLADADKYEDMLDADEDYFDGND